MTPSLVSVIASCTFLFKEMKKTKRGRLSTQKLLVFLLLVINIDISWQGTYQQPITKICVMHKLYCLRGMQDKDTRDKIKFFA